MEEFIISTVYDGKQRKLYPFDCLRCGLTFYAPKHAGRKYCSKQCFNLSERTKIDTICDLCGREFKKRPSSFVKAKHGFYFCSRECKDKAQRLESNFPQIHPPHYGNGAGSYRETARRHYPMVCNRCGYAEQVGILMVHHKDRNHLNTDIKNLEILCPNCHCLEHFMAGDGMYTGSKPRGRGETEITELLQSSVESLSLSASTNIK